MHDVAKLNKWCIDQYGISVHQIPLEDIKDIHNEYSTSTPAGEIGSEI